MNDRAPILIDNPDEKRSITGDADILDAPIGGDVPGKGFCSEIVFADAVELTADITDDPEPGAIRKPGAGHTKLLALAKFEPFMLARFQIDDDRVDIGVAARVDRGKVATIG